WRWQSASGSGARPRPRKSAFSVFTIGHPAFRIAEHRHYMRRARLLALFLDVLVAAIPADLAGLALTGVVWRFLPVLRPAIPLIWAVAGTAAALAFLFRDARGG